MRPGMGKGVIDPAYRPRPINTGGGAGLRSRPKEREAAGRDLVMSCSALERYATCSSQLIPIPNLVTSHGLAWFVALLRIDFMTAIYAHLVIHPLS